jgi:hypothetical protein
MSNTLYIPEANPIHFVPVNPNQSPSYATKFWDTYLFADTLRDFEQQDNFFAPWYRYDLIPLQFTANYEPIQLDLVNCDGDVMLTVTANQVRANRYMPGFFLYQAFIDPSSLGDQLFKILVTPGEDVSQQQKSEWLQLSENIENTVFCEYFNSRFKDDIVYETGIKFGFRFPGFLTEAAPGSESQLYKDQVLNQTQLSNKPFPNWKLFAGEGRGIPPWMINKINRAFSVNNVALDGRLFARPDGAKWTEATEEKKRLVGYSCDLLEGINRPSRIVNSDINPNIKLIVQSNLDGSIFGDTSGQAGQNTVAINSFE